MTTNSRKNRMLDPNCPLSDCLSFIGGAWTPNILLYLSFGPRRFSVLRNEIPLVSAKVLTQRLREMEVKGILTRHVTSGHPVSVEYALTELGRQFLPVVGAIAKVSRRLKENALAEQATPIG